MDKPAFEVEVELRGQDWWRGTQVGAIISFVAPMLARMLEKSRPTCPLPKKTTYYNKPGPWEVSWDKVDDVRGEVIKQLKQTDANMIEQVFEKAMAESLASLAEEHPEELEELLIKNYFVRAVRNIHIGVGSSEPRKGSRS